VSRLLPVLDPRRCVGTAACVEVCPTDCLEMGGANPWLPRPLDCTRCSACVQVCPVDAIALPDSTSPTT
jgi:NAD-dependent dihydropyrimidine dehydrogenase PreA subunit